MVKSYTNIVRFGDSIHHFFIEDGERKYEKIKFKPILAYEAGPDSKSEWKSLKGKALTLKKFDSMRDAKEWKTSAEGTFDVYGDINPVYQFISFNYPNDVPMQKSKMRIGNFDIECPSDSGFPTPDKAEWPIVSITFQDMVSNEYTIFALKDYKPKLKNARHLFFRSEEALLEGFIEFFQDFQLDILTGWNIETFDIPYLVNRMNMLLGEDAPKKLSPVGIINNRTVKVGFAGQEENVYDIIGITVCDYINLYKKFSRDVRESYTLDHVAKMELGEGKLEYKEKGKNLGDLYNEDSDKFFDYNIKDVELVYEIDKKLMFIDLIISVAYMSHAQLGDSMGTVKIWDALLYNKLLHRKIMVPPGKHNTKKAFPGGYVMEPPKGVHEWLAIYDIKSSYPNQTRSWNISPETVIDYCDLPQELRDIREEFRDLEKSLQVDNLAKLKPILQKYNVTFTSNGEFYTRDKEGILPETMGEIFLNRAKLKAEAQNLAGEIAELEKELKAMEACQ